MAKFVLYKYRQLCGIAEYNIIDGNFGDNTLHLQDTTCEHPGAKCEIEVIKCNDDNCYCYSKPLNSSAKRYDYFHKVEKFWTTKKEACIDAIRIKIKNYHENLAVDEKRLTEAKEKLTTIHGGDVHYLTSATAKLGTNCFVLDEGSCRIIGIISFEDGTTGYLTDGNYTSGWDDGDGDRIILIEDKGCKIISENGDDVFLSKLDNDNNEANNKIANLNKMVENYQREIERSTARLNDLHDAFNKSDTLTIDELIAIANS